jgi:NAD-dependent deacetylase
MNIVFLTGAGISVASGMKTFRGPGGIYNDDEVARLSHASAVRTSLDAVWRFWGAMRGEAQAAKPNAAHLAIAALEERLGSSGTVTVITMNVDGLHQRAGSTNVIELHGSLHHSRCTTTGDRFADRETHQFGAPPCGCGGAVRPDIVFFGESLSPYHWNQARQAARYANVFIAVGTSNTVQPASLLVKKPYYKGARTIFVNPEIPLGLRCFREKRTGFAEEVLPPLLEQLTS